MQSLSYYKDKFPQIGLTLILGFVLLVENIVYMVLTSQQIQHSSTFLSLYSISISTILTLWVQHDSRLLGTSLGLDQSMYIFFGWPIMFPAYLFRSRGFRSGGLLLLLFFGIVIFALSTAFVATIVINIVIAIFSAG
jgi:hypothetical protein